MANSKNDKKHLLIDEGGQSRPSGGFGVSV